MNKFKVSLNLHYLHITALTKLLDSPHIKTASLKSLKCAFEIRKTPIPKISKKMRYTELSQTVTYRRY